MRSRALSSKSIAVSVAALSAVSTMAACSGSGHKVAVKPAAVTTPSASASPAPAPVVARDALTGLAARGGPVVAVKIDNAPLARPYQKGLGRSSVLYQELVEGGLTRFLAIYEIKASGTADVGPVRSARESDVGVLRAYDQPPLGFSGANSGVLAIFRSAQRSGWLKDGSYDDFSSAYRLGAQRRDARNFFVDLGKLSSLNSTNTVKDVGFTFSAGTPTTGVPTPSALAAFSSFTRVGLTYHPSAHTWSITQNGTPMTGVAPANIVVQRVAIQHSRFVDVHGQPTPFTKTDGSGSVTILRDGQRLTGTWKRTGFGATRYYNAAGRQIALRPGKTMVLLLPTSGSLTF
ncbi:MAG: CchlO [Frankiales bacterium]|nr:CchlO [Frankiales bacterium]